MSVSPNLVEKQDPIENQDVVPDHQNNMITSDFETEQNFNKLGYIFELCESSKSTNNDFVEHHTVPSSLKNVYKKKNCTNFFPDQINSSNEEIIWGKIYLNPDDKSETATIFFNIENFHKKTWSPFISQYGLSFYNNQEIENCLTECLPSEIKKVKRNLQSKHIKKIILVQNYYKILNCTMELMGLLAPELTHDSSCKCNIWIKVFTPIVYQFEKKIRKLKRFFPKNIIRKHKKQFSQNTCYFQKKFEMIKLCNDFYVAFFLQKNTKN